MRSYEPEVKLCKRRVLSESPLYIGIEMSGIKTCKRALPRGPAAIALLLATASLSLGFAQQAPLAAGAVARSIGAIKAINGTVITLAPDSGPNLQVNVQPTTRILRAEPGEKDLKNAKPITFQDLQIGDRILVGGKLGDDGSLIASTVVAMKQSDLEAKRQRELQDWQKRGVDGPAKAVDPAAGTVTIAVRGKDVVIHTSRNTIIRRYAPDSVKFEDAGPGTLQEIHPADQVRARGERSADGGEMNAEEVVSGTFPNFAATVNSVDASSSTLSVHDLASKKTVIVKVTQDSQLRRLTPEMAQGFAAMLRRMSGGATPNATSNAGPGTGGQGNATTGPGATGGGGSGISGRSGSAPDLLRLFSRAPATSLGDLHKGDAVSILSTQGTGGLGTVIFLLSGVEPILQATPNAAQAMMLAPWSLSAPAGDNGGP